MSSPTSKAVKKVQKAVGGDIQPDEQLLGAVFTQPAGATGAMMARQVGGLVGAAVADKMGGGDSVEMPRDQGQAAAVPSEPLWLGLTSKRVLFWSHSQMRGRPKELKASVDRSDLAGIDMESQKVTWSVLVRFADGSAVPLEAGKMANDPKGFAEACITAGV